MSKEKEIAWLAKEIQLTFSKLVNTYWEVFVGPGEMGFDSSEAFDEYELSDKKTWIYRGTKMLYFKICLFLELKDVPFFYWMFTSKFKSIIEDEKKVMESCSGMYSESEPSLIIHDNFREFLSAFTEFDFEFARKLEKNKLKLILENTHSIIDKTHTKISNEKSIYTPVRWMTGIFYPSTRPLNKARFIKKFGTYHPDILVPEISSAVEYKYIRSGENCEKYLTQIKTDADNYTGDPEYKYFYAVVFFQNKAEINIEAFKQAVEEKRFPNNWEIIAL